VIGVLQFYILPRGSSITDTITNTLGTFFVAGHRDLRLTRWGKRANVSREGETQNGNSSLIKDLS
jgi:hypothetical protein